MIVPKNMEYYCVDLQKPRKSMKVGVSFVNDKKYSIQIAAVRPGSIMEATGLRPGDSILEINGISTKQMTSSEVAKMVSNAAGVVTFRGLRPKTNNYQEIWPVQQQQQKPESSSSNKDDKRYDYFILYGRVIKFPSLRKRERYLV